MEILLYDMKWEKKRKKKEIGCLIGWDRKRQNIDHYKPINNK